MKSRRLFIGDNKSVLLDWIKQVIRYGFVGFAGTLLSLAIYWPIVLIREDLYIAAYSLCFLVSVLFTYWLNNKFVFAKKERGHAKPLLKAYTSYGIAFLVGTVFLYILVQLFEVPATIAPVLILFVTVPINFLLNRFWTFK
ncbi:MAG TPA: GtrA family protein [Clostridia bacterium]|nr:GtrA family protein [Clostridia bacterium]